MSISIFPSFLSVFLIPLGILLLVVPVFLVVLWLLRPVFRMIARSERDTDREVSNPPEHSGPAEKPPSRGHWFWRTAWVWAVSISIVPFIGLLAVRRVETQPLISAPAVAAQAPIPPRPIEVVIAPDTAGMSTPKITLAEEEEPAIEGVEAETQEPPLEAPPSQKKPAAPEPAWMTKPLQPNQAILISDPFQNESECRRDLDGKTLRWAGEQLRLELGDTASDPTGLGAKLDETRERLLRSEHAVRRDTSVGSMTVVHRLVELNDHDQQWLRLVAAQQGYRRAGLAVALLGCGLLGALAVTYAVLSIGGPARSDPS